MFITKIKIYFVYQNHIRFEVSEQKVTSIIILHRHFHETNSSHLKCKTLIVKLGSIVSRKTVLFNWCFHLKSKGILFSVRNISKNTGIYVCVFFHLFRELSDDIGWVTSEGGAPKISHSQRKGRNVFLFALIHI